MNAAEKLLSSILAELDLLGVGADEEISGGDAVEYLNDLRNTISNFLRGKK